jgi:segregation and condensation protein A
MESYTVATDVFEGPLDLLLSLIEKRKIFINDVSLAEVTNDYLRYVEQHSDFPIDDTAQFVLIGSTLLLIKSKSLLPTLNLTTEEQDSVEDLETRLRVLDTYRVGARHVQMQYGTNVLFGRNRVYAKESTFAPDSTYTRDMALRHIDAVLARLPEEKVAIPKKTVEKVVSLEEMMCRLEDRMTKTMQVSFRDFSGGGGKVEVIVSFLAMLELMRQGLISVEQASLRGDITMSTDTVATPRYS